MRRIDQQIGLGLLQIGREPFRAAEAADTCRHLLRDRIFGAPRQRQDKFDIRPRRQPAGQLPCLSGAAQDQNAVGHHAC